MKMQPEPLSNTEPRLDPHPPSAPRLVPLSRTAGEGAERSEAGEVVPPIEFLSSECTLRPPGNSVVNLAYGYVQSCLWAVIRRKPGPQGKRSSPGPLASRFRGNDG